MASIKLMLTFRPGFEARLTLTQEFLLFMSCVALDYSISKLKDKQHKQKTVLKSYNNEIKLLANPGLAKSGFEQPGPGYEK